MRSPRASRKDSSGASGAAEDLLHLRHLVRDFGRLRGDGAGEDVAVAANVLGGAVDSNIDARDLGGTLVEGRREGRVAHDPRPWLVRVRRRVVVDDLADLVEVSQPAGWVGRALRVDDSRVRLERPCVVRRVGRVDEGELDAPVLEVLDAKFVGAAVHRVREDGVVAGAEPRLQRRGDRRHPGREEHRAALVARADALQRRQLPRRALVGRRAPPPVHVAVFVGVRRLRLLVQPCAVRRVLELKGRAEHERQAHRLDAAHRKVGDLDDGRAARLVAILLPVGPWRADRHAGADFTVLEDGHVPLAPK